jgi:spermidine/putrescine transport system ATP-binding protein
VKLSYKGLEMNLSQVVVDRIVKRFGETIALQDVSLQVERGQFLTLLGPSGCGKTTLLRIIAGFEEPNEGCIQIAGKDMTYMPPHKRPVNMVFQKYALFPHLSVFEDVAFGLRIKKLSANIINSKVERMLALVQLSEFGGRMVNQLSGGQAQRVALARALVNEPEVLLLDEPLAALDLKIRQQMQIELKLLHAELGITFIYVTHDQEEAMTISDRIVVISAGMIVQDGTPGEIYNYPASAFVAEFIGHSNIIDAVVRSISPVKLGFWEGEHLCRECRELQMGQNVKALLRPEAILISSEESIHNSDQVTGTIVDATFKGPFVDYLVNIEHQRMKIHQSIHDGVRVLQRGEKAYLHWSPDDLIVLPG